MPSVMIRKNDAGQLTLYVAKKDQEDPIETVEIDTGDQWGGNVTLNDGTCYYIEPITNPDFPLTVRAKRGEA